MPEIEELCIGVLEQLNRRRRALRRVVDQRRRPPHHQQIPFVIRHPRLQNLGPLGR